MKPVIIEPEAVADLEASCGWYAEVGGEPLKPFVLAVEEAIDSARERPTSFPFVHSLTRRVRVHKFPYAVLFQDSADATIVLGVLHAAMDVTRFLRRSR